MLRHQIKPGRSAHGCRIPLLTIRQCTGIIVRTLTRNPATEGGARNGAVSMVSCKRDCTCKQWQCLTITRKIGAATLMSWWCQACTASLAGLGTNDVETEDATLSEDCEVNSYTTSMQLHPLPLNAEAYCVPMFADIDSTLLTAIWHGIGVECAATLKD